MLTDPWGGPVLSDPRACPCPHASPSTPVPTDPLGLSMSSRTLQAVLVPVYPWVSLSLRPPWHPSHSRGPLDLSLSPWDTPGTTSSRPVPWHLLNLLQKVLLPAGFTPGAAHPCHGQTLHCYPTSRAVPFADQHSNKPCLLWALTFELKPK